MKTSILATITATLLLVGCSHYSEDLASLDGEMSKPMVEPQMIATTTMPQNIETAAGGGMGAIQNQATMPNMMPQYMAREYYTMAKYENDQAYDYKASKMFTKKAMMAAQGKMMEPSKVSSFDIPDDRKAELEQARSDLMIALADNNTPENAKALSAAQTKFECWLERAEEAVNEDHYSSCKSGFVEAMASLMVAPAAPTTTQISFLPNKGDLDAPSVQSIDAIAQFLNDPANANVNIQLMGVMAESQGEYGVNLATLRVRNVQNLLVSKGVSSNRMTAGLSPAVANSGNAGKVEIMIVAPQAQASAPSVYPAVQVAPPTNM